MSEVTDEQIRIEAAKLILSGKTLEQSELGDEMSGCVKELLAGTAGIDVPRQLKTDIITDAKEAQSTTSHETTESVVNPELAAYRRQYDRLPDDTKSHCSWEVVAERLLANGGEKLSLVKGLVSGGVLFGLDGKGRLLFADSDPEPILTGMTYSDARKAVMFTSKNGKQVSTGYEMFPCAHVCYKSSEILAYEAQVQDQFIRSEDKKEWRGSWLDSGENPDQPRYARFIPVSGNVNLYSVSSKRSDPLIGVRRLVRV